jgi:hypothetical protein
MTAMLTVTVIAQKAVSAALLLHVIYVVVKAVTAVMVAAVVVLTFMIAI